MVNIGFDDILPCQIGNRPGTSTRRRLCESMTDFGQYAAKSSPAEGRIDGHAARKYSLTTHRDTHALLPFLGLLFSQLCI